MNQRHSHQEGWRIGITLAGGIMGLAWALSLRAWLAAQPLREGAPPSLATSMGINPNAAFRAVFGAIILALLGAFLFRAASSRIVAADSERWGRWAVPAGALFSLWVAILEPMAFLWIATIPLSVLAAAWLARRFDPRFSRRDVAMLPSILLLYFALLDLAPNPSAARDFSKAVFFVFLIRFALGAVDRLRAHRVPAGWSFFLSPLAAPLLIEPSPYPRGVRAAVAAAIILVSPVLVRFLIPATPRAMKILRITLAFVVYPIFVTSYPWTATQYALEKAPRMDVFEDGHNLMPAGEMLRGELPYRDVIPGHGLISDGLLDLAALKWVGDTAGDALWLRGLVASLAPVALYAAGAAATGSAEAGLLGFLFAAAAMVGGTRSLRAFPAIASLALLMVAARRGSRRWLVAAGAVLSLAFLTSLDFAAYTFFAAVIAVVRFNPGARARLRAAGALIGGMTLGFLPVAIPFAFWGILDNFFRVTLNDIMGLGPYYSLGFRGLPPGLEQFRAFPETLGMIAHLQGMIVMMWFVAAVVFAGLLASRARLRSVRTEPLLLIAAWITIASLSYAERFHTYYEFLLGPFAITLVWVMAKRGHLLRQFGAGLLAATLVVAVHPTTHLIISSLLRKSEAPIEPGWIPWNGAPRAAGVLIRETQIPMLQSAKDFIESHLGPDQTFFDFANRPLLYYLFEKPAPIPQYEVAHFQRAKRERETARALERDRSIQAVLIRYGDESDVDGIPNRERAPKVWEIIERDFQPAWDRDGVVFWIRK